MKRVLYLVMMLISINSLQGQNIFRNAKSSASSENKEYGSSKAFDGIVSRSSCWKSDTQARPPHILEVSTPHYYHVDSVVIYTGIPLAEQTAAEKSLSAGFTSMKNFRVQYWDDANWTDLPETVTSENRKERVVFNFKPAIRTFQFRIISLDGEAVMVNEFEGYGKVDKSYAVQSMDFVANKTAASNKPTNISAVIDPEVKGTSMEYVAYNQGYYNIGSNATAWIDYSDVNNVRLWASLSSYVPREAVGDASGVTSLKEFDKRKDALRQDPENSQIKWDIIAERASGKIPDINVMALDYVLEQLKSIDVKVIMQVNSKDFDGTWSNSWQQWQRYYALAFYAAKKGDVGMFAAQNEPNHVHSGPMTIDQWIGLMRIVSDAVNCAVEDVNKLYNKDIEPCYVGPVTAGTNANWWSAIARAERVDYRGNKTDKDLIDLFSIHSYNSPAQGYATKVTDVNNLIKENHPLGLGKDIVYTETGRWMNAYLIDKEETMDSPSLFTEWAGMYTNNMLNGCKGMWAFKFSNTNDSAYKYGKKSGHHHTWQGRRFIEGEANNVALNAKVTASTGEDASRVVDGDKSDDSAWQTDAKGAKWLEVELAQSQNIGGLALYSGSAGGEYTAPDRIRELNFEAFVDGQWTAIPKAAEHKNRYAQLIYIFDDEVNASKFRLNILDEDRAKVREIKLFEASSIYLDQSYDICGVQRTAQVVRLFAKGFKDSRDLLTIKRSSPDQDLDIECSVDAKTNKKYIWIVQRNLSDYKLSLDLKSLGVEQGDRILSEVVGHSSYGEAEVMVVGDPSQFKVEVPMQSVTLLTISDNAAYKTTKAKSVAVVQGGEHSNSNFDKGALRVELNSQDKSKNAVTYMSFADKADEPNTATLTVSGSSSDDELFRFHVYAYGSDKPINSKTLTWDNAAHLEANRAMVKGLDKELKVAGEMSFDASTSTRSLDITELLRENEHKYLNFILIREVRETGDDYDHGRSATIEPSAIIEIW